jgi:16S rRNA (adenine1518-N6/adenine1519-N6)-dimethyltransferase
MVAPRKSLGQHWLKDRATLVRLADFAEVDGDTVLEIGPGLGFLTSVLLARADSVVAVEYDDNLAAKLPASFPGKNLTVVSADFLNYDLNQLPRGYKVVANVPYYITSKIVQRLLTAENKPTEIVLLVQKEVAERLAAGPGRLSILGISAQVYADVQLGEIVPAKMFTPPPKVDSQVVKLTPHTGAVLADEKEFFRLVKVGFSSPRKKVTGNLASGLHMERAEIERVFGSLDLDLNLRAQDLTIGNWRALLPLLQGQTL